MHSKVISDRGLKRLFDGEVTRSFRRGGELASYSVKPFRHEGTERAIFEASRTLPDVRGVYRAKAIVEDLKASRSSCFFPREWTRGEVLQAIGEAYAVRVPVKKKRGDFCEGVSSAGVKIVLELDADGLVLDAVPQVGTQLKKRKFCASCGASKERQWICPRGHNIPKRRTLYKRLRYQSRRVWFGLWSKLEGSR
jgi:hypothetical protein